MNLTSYADLAVRLVNTAVRVDEHVRPGGPDTIRAPGADGASLVAPVTHHDRDALGLLHAELALIFTAAAEGEHQVAAERLNTLLIQHPIHPELVSHDNQRWHLHLADTGSETERFAARAVFGLVLFANQFGLERLGVCAIASCPRVFLDSSSNRSRRYCAEHGAARATVTAIGSQRRPGGIDSASTAAG